MKSGQFKIPPTAFSEQTAKYNDRRWNIGKSIIGQNAMEKHFGEINIGDLDEMQ